jgi:hypothetical protein
MNSAAKKTLVSTLLNEDDYKELGHSIVLRNDTSGISFLDSKKLIVKELREESICISIPKNICQVGHIITFILFRSPLKKEFKKFPNLDSTKGLPIIGKVIELESESENVLIEIKFTQFKEQEWNKVISLYREQQAKISNLISLVKK